MISFKKEINWVMEVLDIWINVARRDVGEREWNLIFFFIGI